MLYGSVVIPDACVDAVACCMSAAGVDDRRHQLGPDGVAVLAPTLARLPKLQELRYASGRATLYICVM